MILDGLTLDQHLDAVKAIHKRETAGLEEAKHDSFEMGRENWERNMDLIGHSLVLLRREKSKAYPEGCWCDACLNNPNVTEHTKACKNAQTTLGILGYEPQDPIKSSMV